MRGVSLRGRRLPANRSAGPARPPVVPAAVPRRSRCGHAASGFAATRRTVPAGPYPRDCRPQEYYYPPWRRSWERRPQDQVCQRVPSPVAPGIRPGLRHCPSTGQHPVTCTDSRCRRPPSGASAVPRGRWRASPHCSCPRRHFAAAGPAAARALPGTPCAHPVPGPVVPHKPAVRVLAGSVPRRRVKPCPPPISHRFRGAVATA